MLARVYAAETLGLLPKIVTVEVDISRGLHSFSIVGLPDRAVEEARERINSAIKNSGFRPPVKGGKKIVVSLAPADLKKEGPIFDLSIALANLLAEKQIDFDPAGKLFLGELGLNGELRPIRGGLVIAQGAKEAGFREIFLPKENALEAALIDGVSIYGAGSLAEVASHLNPKEENRPIPKTKARNEDLHREVDHRYDFKDIGGQEEAKRGLEIAAAGGHNIALVGPPGTGKTLLARAFPSILPNLELSHSIEVTGIHSVSGTLGGDRVITRPPYRAPHHTSSYVALSGGGAIPKPGEITLAHRGVLFLDEFPEFEKRVIDALRQPLEDKIITISRAKESVTFPANFILLAAMNLCPCGNTGRAKRDCICTPRDLMRYRRKISGPIIDRIDIWLSVPEIPPEKLREGEGERSDAIARRVQKARDFQKKLFETLFLRLATISDAGPKEIKKIIPTSPEVEKILDEASDRLSLSSRSYHKVLKVAKTISILDEKSFIEKDHILEALRYRPKEQVF